MFKKKHFRCNNINIKLLKFYLFIKVTGTPITKKLFLIEKETLQL